MVAYSFKKQFGPVIQSGSKRQTIRADRRRHVRPGEELQLYTGMRTTSCRLLGRATCLAVSPILLQLNAHQAALWVVTPDVVIYGVDIAGLTDFARADGFDDWQQLKAFWAQNHPGIDRFSGVLIRWSDIHGR